MLLANIRMATIVFCLVGLCGCETLPVKAWQRGDLARRDMAWEPDSIMSSYREHVYTSKEGSAGGIGTGGGGCGCY